MVLYVHNGAKNNTAHKIRYFLCKNYDSKELNQKQINENVIKKTLGEVTVKFTKVFYNMVKTQYIRSIPSNISYLGIKTYDNYIEPL